MWAADIYENIVSYSMYTDEDTLKMPEVGSLYFEVQGDEKYPKSSLEIEQFATENLNVPIFRKYYYADNVEYEIKDEELLEINEYNTQDGYIQYKLEAKKAGTTSVRFCMKDTGYVLGEYNITVIPHSLITDIQKPESVIIDRYREWDYQEEGEDYGDYPELEMTWDNGKVTKESVQYAGLIKEGDNYLEPDFSDLKYKYQSLDKLFDKAESEYNAQKKITVNVHEIVERVIEPTNTVFETIQDVPELDFNVKIVYDDGTVKEDHRIYQHGIENTENKGERKVVVFNGVGEEIHSFLIKILNDDEYFDSYLEITKLPDKLEYYEGEEVDLTGGLAFAQDWKTRSGAANIDMAGSSIKVGDYSKTEGVQSIPISFAFENGNVLTTSFDVTYIKKPTEAIEPTQQSEEPTQQSEEPTQQSEEPTQQSEEPTQQSEEPTQQSEEPTQQSEEPTKQSEEPTQQSEEPTKQGEEPTKQSEEPTQQSEEPTQQSEEPTQQSEEPTKSSVKNVNNTVDKTKNNTLNSGTSNIGGNLITSNVVDTNKSRSNAVITPVLSNNVYESNNSAKVATNKTSPQTGDKSLTPLWITIAGTSAGVLATAVIAKRKKKI